MFRCINHSLSFQNGLPHEFDYFCVIAIFDKEVDVYSGARQFRFPMRRKLLTTVLSVIPLALFLTAPGLSAQDDIFVTPIPNAPFSGVINVQRSIVRQDGTVVNLKTARAIHRDSRGRIYNEYRTLLPASSSETPEVTRVLLYDPQTRTSTTLFPPQHAYRSTTTRRPPATTPPLFASYGPPNDFTREEDLGVQEMQGLGVHGLRHTQTIPADGAGSDKDIVVSDEYWYSEDLRINLVLKHNDPRTGSVIMTVTKIARADPDSSLFQIPDGYTGPEAAR
jgi:hypothetical protein